MLGELCTPFPRLVFLALHKTIHSPHVFSFPQSFIQALTIEAKNVQDRDRQIQLDSQLRLALQHTRHSLRLLILRSGRTWQLSSATWRDWTSMQRLSQILLDGAITIDSSLGCVSKSPGCIDSTVVGIVSWLDQRVSQFLHPPASLLNHCSFQTSTRKIELASRRVHLWHAYAGMSSGGKHLLTLVLG